MAAVMASPEEPQHGPQQLRELLEELAKGLDGSITFPGYGWEPPVWNALLKSDAESSRQLVPCNKPFCYARCMSNADVLACVKFAVQHRILLCARGNGCHYAGACCGADAGMVIDMSAMQQITLDPAACTATIQPGVTTLQLREALAPHNLHFPGGHISFVGCSGFILGGGNGWGASQYGAACDNVTGFEVILPLPEDQGGCQVRKVTADSDPELFTGLKGGGAFLGIVTAFHVTVHRVRPLLPTLTAVYPLSAAQEVVALHSKLLATAPRCVEASVAFVRDAESPGTPPRVILGCTSILPAPIAGSADAASAQGAAQGVAAAPAAGTQGIVAVQHEAVQAVQPQAVPEGDTDEVAVAVQTAYDRVRALLPERRLALQDELLPYLQGLAVLDPAWSWPGLCLYGHGMFVEQQDVTPELVEKVVAATEAMTSPRSLILLCPAVPVVDQPSSFCFRGGLFLPAYAMWARTAGGPEADGDARHAAWVRGVESALGDAVIGLYMNETMWDQEGQLGRCYDAPTLAVLRATKARTDPLRLLRAL